ncbi:6-carboxy-5,6,7,8-tetrahydropterin synthase [Synechococcus phage BUCT-ZZ01]|nr:6-carboxy-5,6,7,8-tetrahydropterin synthase [Synechococcus phage BUCT-ZZ01]
MANKFKYLSTKTFGNDRGLSCVFRQPNATHSHCSLLHGYSLGFKFTFGTNELDHNNWCYDFGNTKWIKEKLENWFDHTWAVDYNDPQISEIISFVNSTNIATLHLTNGVGCEKFAEQVFNYVDSIVSGQTNNRVKLVSVECFEHGANSAIYNGEE